jgi:hypothetical protein
VDADHAAYPVEDPPVAEPAPVAADAAHGAAGRGVFDFEEEPAPARAFFSEEEATRPGVFDFEHDSSIARAA